MRLLLALTLIFSAIHSGESMPLDSLIRFRVSANQSALYGICPVTLPNGNTPPYTSLDSAWHGNGKLWVLIAPFGVFLVDTKAVAADGSIEIKIPWNRGGRGELIIEGKRLDKPSPSLQAIVPAGYGETGFQATGLRFPTEGCWEIKGRVGNTTLNFVTLVLKVNKSMFISQ
jgi:hypothetical protein